MRPGVVTIVPRVSIALLLVSAMTLPSHARPQASASLDRVLQDAADYVMRFRNRLSGIVAEEHYRQLARTYSGTSGRLGGFGRQRRELRSDFLLVRPEGEDHYFEFRDVFEVDGRPVRDREERLSRLFIDPSESSSEKILEITTESARYNIGSVERTLNTPTLALLLLDARYQSNVRFNVTTETAPGLDLDLDDVLSSRDVVTIEFVEQGRDTLVRGERDARLPSVGRFWIELGTGVVLASELVVGSPTVTAIIDVQYGFEAAMESYVPVEMRERYEGVRDGTRIDGTATYSRFRQFRVHVDETQDTGPETEPNTAAAPRG